MVACPAAQSPRAAGRGRPQGPPLLREIRAKGRCAARQKAANPETGSPRYPGRGGSLEEGYSTHRRARARADLKWQSQKQEEIRKLSQVGEVFNNQQLLLE